MHIKVYLFLALFFILNLYSQGEANIWYFGSHAGLDFSNGAPVALTNGQIDTAEGCATISDANGQLLFYTDGKKVWNKNHQVMSNGSGLKGSSSSTQAALAIPKPGSQTIYYLFTSTDLANPEGVRYSVIDMSLNGGLGNVTSVKNVLLLTPASEKITAVKNADNTGYWVVVHNYGDNSFRAYAVTAAGLSPTPVISYSGSVINDNVNETVGYLKFSPDGTKLICCNYQDNVELFDFNAATGVISNPRFMHTDDSNYGIEFSPSGNVAYLTTGAGFILKLYQYNLNAVNIAQSQILIYTSPVQLQQIMGLQLANNGKIYAAFTDVSYVGVINDPEILGLGCNFVANGVSLGSGISHAGLPQFIQSFFNVGIGFNNTCLGDATVFTLINNPGIISANWDFGDGSISSAISPSHTYTQAGNYTVTVTANGNSGTATSQRQVTISDVPVANAIGNQVTCGSAGMSYNLAQHNTTVLGSQDTAKFSVAYFSSLANAEAHSNVLPSAATLSLGTTTFFAKVYNTTNNKCSAITSFTVTLNAQPLASTVANYVICENQPYNNIEQFDLSTKNPEVLAGQSSSQFTITYHTSQADADSGTNALPLLYTNTNPQETLYARIENNLSPACYAVSSFIVSVVQQPVIGAVSNFVLCDDAANNGLEIFDLSLKTAEILGSLPSTSFEVKYYLTQQQAENNLSPVTAPIQNTANGQTIYFSVSAIGNLSCSVISNFKLIVSNSPAAIKPGDIMLCDDNNDGHQSFNLSLQNQAILGNQSAAQYSVTYYASQPDASLGQNELNSTNYQNISSPQLVFARVQNISNPDCFAITSFFIIVNKLPYAISPLAVHMCEAAEDTNKAIFDLQSITPDVLGTQTNTEFSASYFSSLSDAQLGNNPLADLYENESNPQTIYARVSNNTNPSCNAIANVNLVVNLKPLIDMKDTYALCEGHYIQISAPTGFDSYTWSTGEVSRSIYITQPGTYSLTVTRDYGTIICENTKDIIVVTSDVARIDDVKIDDWTTNSNTIYIAANGIGDYEYSINGKDYQQNPEFTNLEVGVYSVYVRDKNGCGITAEEVYLLNYPKFFTPNNDGINETWKIQFSQYEPKTLVYIFDRYGKMITSFSGQSAGWDGTYNNKPLPSTDYWFVVKRDDGREFKGHFTLIR